MKYGVFFPLISFLFVIYAIANGRWSLLLLWPAVSFGVVGSAYLYFGHRVFGKRANGLMSIGSVTLLLPYLLFLWTVWHFMRFLSRESPVDTVCDKITIGRRLLSHERPSGIDAVVDLTCEFFEPRSLRSARQYITFPILDAAALPPHDLARFVRQLAEVDGQIFIHCAQGHGRTGLIAALLLIARGLAADADEALARVRASRPLVGLSHAQLSALRNTAALLAPVG